MNYSYEERLNIGREIYDNELSKHDATVKYGISLNTAREYMRMYRDEYSLPPKQSVRKCGNGAVTVKTASYDEFDSMSREELIAEIIKAKINEARAKKGYQVKGDGAEKVFVPIENKNTK